MTRTRTRAAPAATALGLRAIAVAGLAVDGYVHLHLAPDYDPVGETITQGALFRVEATFAVVAAVLLTARDTRLTWLFAGLTALAGATAVLATRYVDVPALGPFPRMSEPLWYPEKAWVTVAMLAAAFAWLLREALRGRNQE